MSKTLPAVAVGNRVRFLRIDGVTQWEGRVWSLAPGGYWVIPDGDTKPVKVAWRNRSDSSLPKHAVGRKLREVPS